MDRSYPLSRREFLKVVGLGAMAASLPPDWEGEIPVSWPSLEIKGLPLGIQNILELAPELIIRQDGLLAKKGSDLHLHLAPQMQTQWNLEHNRPGDRLIPGFLTGIVLHWYGDHDNFDRSIKGYLRGFNSLRQVGEYETRTSAHFLVGGCNPWFDSPEDVNISIIQTQLPYSDGSPLIASHINGLSLGAHLEKKQYFVRAMYELGLGGYRSRSLLQEMYDGRRIDPNMRTLAVEITGYNFDQLEHTPSNQKTGNVVALVAAIMKRYKIRALDLLGHNEIFLGKPDPGKQFLAMIRYLIGVKALIDQDQDLLELTYYPFLDGSDKKAAVEAYFEFVRSYLRLISTPEKVYLWEKRTGYWNLMALISKSAIKRTVSRLRYPVGSKAVIDPRAYLIPENHEGVDFSSLQSGGDPGGIKRVYLVTDGKCLFKGKSVGCKAGQATIFRHLSPDGAEFLSVYSHLNELANYRSGQFLTGGTYLGEMERLPWKKDGFLHYAIAYGATWDTDLQYRSSIPVNAGPAWIRQRYISPLEFHRENTPTQSSNFKQPPVD